MPNVSTVPSALRKSNPVPLSDRALWSLADASRATSLSVRLIQRLIAEGRLPCVRIGRRVLLDPVATRAALLATSESASV